MSETRQFVISVELRPGESVRVANGGNFIRLDVQGSGRDQVKAKAIHAAREAGVITEDDARRKLVECGQFVADSWMWATDEPDCIRRASADEVISKKAAELLAGIRKRIGG